MPKVKAFIASIYQLLMRYYLIEQMRWSFAIFMENKYYIINHVGTLLVAPGLARDMMLIWQPALWSSPL